MEDKGLSVSCRQYGNSISSIVDSFQALDLFGFEVYIPVTAINYSEVKTAKKHLCRFVCQPRFQCYKRTARHFVRQRYPSQRIVFVSKTRDQPEPGSFFGGGGREMKEPGNEVGQCIIIDWSTINNNNNTLI